MSAVPMVAVRPEQGPPLSVPIGFFLTAPLAIGAAGLVLLTRADDGIKTLWAPSNVAVMHLGVVGLLLVTMIGALYQLLPVVGGAVVPAPRLAHVVHALLVGGAVALVTGQWRGTPGAFLVAIVLLSLALVLFLVPAGYALLRSRVPGPTAMGLRVALLALVAVGYAGLRLSATRAGAGFEGDWLALRWAHLNLGFLCWVGGLVAAVSWQVLPMFFLVASPPRAVAWGVLGGVVLSLVLLSGVFVVEVFADTVKWLALPGAVAVWLVQPAWALWALAHRRRKRRDATSWYWWLAMAVAPGCFALGATCALVPSARWPMIYGVCVLWAWAGLLMHGMLTRIVPFLVWLHWCAPQVGKVKTPSAKELLTDREVAVGFALHVVSIAAAFAAVVSEEPLAWRVFGASLVLVAVALASEVTTALRRGRAAPAPG